MPYKRDAKLSCPHPPINIAGSGRKKCTTELKVCEHSKYFVYLI